METKINENDIGTKLEWFQLADGRASEKRPENGGKLRRGSHWTYVPENLRKSRHVLVYFQTAIILFVVYKH